MNGASSVDPPNPDHEYQFLKWRLSVFAKGLHCHGHASEFSDEPASPAAPFGATASEVQHLLSRLSMLGEGRHRPGCREWYDDWLGDHAPEYEHLRLQSIVLRLAQKCADAAAATDDSGTQRADGTDWIRCVCMRLRSNDLRDLADATIIYFGPPFGIVQKRFLEPVENWIHDRVCRRLRSLFKALSEREPCDARSNEHFAKRLWPFAFTMLEFQLFVELLEATVNEFKDSEGAELACHVDSPCESLAHLLQNMKSAPRCWARAR